MNYFLPVFGKLVFPCAMPFCFRLPPTVAGAASPMRPMPDYMRPALRDHCIATSGAFGRQARPSFSTLSFNDGKFHLFSPHGQSALNRLFDRAAVRDAG